MAYTIVDIYNSYKADKNQYVDKETFKNICNQFNIMIMDYILEGKEFNMGYNLSTLSIVRRERDPRTPRINWGESNKYKKELVEQGKKLYSADTDSGEKWHIYHTDGFYCKFYWRKGKCSVPNKSVYRFDATRGIKGNKEKLINLLKTDELAYLKFKKN
jgi:hypothetical protein|tara:strand:+ start:355 stop:831 length:477 start_codon:yes stop_codon:yes gene_type:complete